MNLVRVRVWASLCLVLWSASFAGAQVGGGAMTGVVTDAMGTVTPGATVTATNRRTGLARSVVTNASGVYTVPGLLPGLYVVDVTLSGFPIASALSGHERQLRARSVPARSSLFARVATHHASRCAEHRN